MALQSRQRCSQCRQLLAHIALGAFQDGHLRFEVLDGLFQPVDPGVCVCGHLLTSSRILELRISRCNFAVVGPKRRPGTLSGHPVFGFLGRARALELVVTLGVLAASSRSLTLAGDDKGPVRSTGPLYATSYGLSNCPLLSLSSHL